MKLKTYLNQELMRSRNTAIDNPEVALNMALEVADLAKQFKLKSEYATALFYMAFACRMNSEYALGLKYAFESLEIHKKLKHDVGIYKAKNLIGVLYFYSGALTDALEFFMEALEEVKRTRDHFMETSILNNVGEVYREAMHFEKAKHYYQEALKLCQGETLEVNKATILLNIVEIDHNRGDFRISSGLLQEAYEIFKKHGMVLEIAESETKLGRAARNQGQFERAKNYFKSALERFHSIGNKFYLVDLLMEMAAYDIDTGKNPLRNFNEALDAAESRKLQKKILTIYQEISKYYESVEEFKLSLEYYKKYHLKQSEVEASNMTIRLEILEIEFSRYKESGEQIRLKRLSEKLKRDVQNANAALEQLKTANKTLLIESLIDELTQLLNRRGIERRFHDLYSDTENHKSKKATVMIVDIDRFKNYNDTWGHLVGDQCLTSVAEIFRQMDYPNYFAGRFGGEEFIIYFETERWETAYEVADDIRNAVSDLNIRANKEDHKNVTVSIGVYHGDMTALSLTACIHKADLMLYKAKDAGRNNIQMDCET